MNNKTKVEMQRKINELRDLNTAEKLLLKTLFDYMGGNSRTVPMSDDVVCYLVDCKKRTLSRNIKALVAKGHISRIKVADRKSIYVFLFITCDSNFKIFLDPVDR